jgi:RND family efflux transporter MFP subunit
MIRRTLVSLFAGASLLVLAACNETTAQKTEDIRPVKTAVVSFREAGRTLSLAGTVTARTESPLAFQVAGKMVERRVDAGATVKAGAVIARLDPEDYRLRVREAQAALSSAEADLARSRADLDRYARLKESQVFVQAVYDQRLAAANVAGSSVQRARSALKIAENQLGYAELLAPADGIVTRVIAEPGQVVQAGQAILTLAQDDGLEVSVGVPENRIEEVKAARSVQVSLWAESGSEQTAVLRELSPSADPATRTYTARFSLPNPTAGTQLGMTATVKIHQPLTRPVARLPLSAIFQKGSTPAVWVVDTATGAVTLTPVDVAAFREDGAWISGGITEGQVVVAAGVNKVDAGQKVRLLDAAMLGAVK